MASSAHDQPSHPATLKAGMVLLMSFSSECLARLSPESLSRVRTSSGFGRIKHLEVSPAHTFPTASGDLLIAPAQVIVNSSGTGNVRSDIEADVRKLTGTTRADAEVTVAMVPGKPFIDPTPEAIAHINDGMRRAAVAMFGDQSQLPAGRQEEETE